MVEDQTKTRKPTVKQVDEKLKYPERVHVITDYMVEGMNFANWDNIWVRMEGTEESEKKFIFSYGIGEATMETKDKKMVIPCMLYTPETTLNILSIDQLEDQDPKEECSLIKGLEELKWDKNEVHDYLDEDYISMNGTVYAIKVNSFPRYVRTSTTSHRRCREIVLLGLSTRG
ncbi:hypothetical protein Tco_1150941 [Tanacetum coccineum]